MRRYLRSLLYRLADWLDRVFPLPEDDATGAGLDEADRLDRR
jgi:hypothetical protein